MGKKKKKGKKKKAEDENLPPPEDPKDKLTEQEIAYWKEMFEMADIDKSGTLDYDRVLEIFEDMTD